MGGGLLRLASIVRICTGDVWVRRSTVSAPSSSAVEVERVPHAAGPGGRRRHVERLEVVPVGLDLGALGDGEAHADEHVLEALPRLGDEVGVAERGVAERLGEVEALGLELLDPRPPRRARPVAPRRPPRAAAAPR